jgi:hypothetical protein
VLQEDLATGTALPALVRRESEYGGVFGSSALVERKSLCRYSRQRCLRKRRRERKTNLELLAGQT